MAKMSKHIYKTQGTRLHVDKIIIGKYIPWAEQIIIVNLLSKICLHPWILVVIYLSPSKGIHSYNSSLKQFFSQYK